MGALDPGKRRRVDGSIPEQPSSCRPGAQVHPRRAPVRAEETGEQADDVVGEYHVQQPHCPSPFPVQARILHSGGQCQ